MWQVRTSNIYSFRVTMDELVLEINDACSISDNDIDLIALVTMAEAEGESELGKRLVIDTILNRFESDLFPDSIEDVIYQKNQFTSMWNGRIEKCYIDDTIRQLVVEELDCRRDDKVIYFTAGWYGKYGTPTYRVGHHYFFLSMKGGFTMSGIMGFTFSAFAGICFFGGIAVLLGGKEH